MTMSSIRPNHVKVDTKNQIPRSWTPAQKLEVKKQSNEHGSCVCLVA